mmetsp:Transcript_9803/g.11096  ORF Transcript_9803/g.11096 Transcript_9803/m.11096 type:complete len:315 (-) Transcript_9803:12-956(-)
MEEKEPAIERKKPKRCCFFLKNNTSPRRFLPVDGTGHLNENGDNERVRQEGFLQALGALNDLHELGLERGTPNKEPIDVGALVEGIAVARSDRTTIQNADLLGNHGVHIVLDPLTEDVVNLLRLLRRGNLSGTNSPYGLIRNHNLLPVCRAQLLGNGTELRKNDGSGAAIFTLLQGLPDAGNHSEASSDRGLDLGGNHVVRLAVVLAALAVTQDDPIQAQILQNGERHLTSECAALYDTVLGANSELGILQQVLNEANMNKGGRNHALHVMVDLCIVEDGQQVRDARDGAIALPVCGNNRLGLCGHLVGLKTIQ